MSGAINGYLQKNIKDLNSTEKLCGIIHNRSKKVKVNPKQLLSQLRELCVHVTANVGFENSFTVGLIEQIKELSDQDADRKLLRVYLFVLMEVLHKEMKPQDHSKMMDVADFLLKEVASRTNSRQYLAFRTLGILYAINRRNEVNESINENIFKLVTHSLKDLKYAGKQKKTLFHTDKDYLSKTLHWNSIMSSLQHMKRVIPKECYANLFYGVLSQYTPLVRNSLLVLLHTVEVLIDEQSILELCSMLIDRYHKGSEYLNLDDPLSATYFIRIIAAVAYNVNWDNAECKARVLDLFVIASDFLKNKSVKVVCEAVSLLVDHSYSWTVLSMLHARSSSRIFPLMIDALIAHIKVLPHDSVLMPLVYRTCVKLGRFLIMRPRNTASQPGQFPLLSASAVEKDGVALIPLWTALKRYHYKKLILPSGLPSNTQGLVNSGVINGDRGVPLDESYYSVCENRRVANPHRLCELIKALIWIAPDKRYCKKEHTLLWKAFNANLTETCAVLAVSAPDCSESLLESVLANYFARVRASMLVTTTPVPIITTVEVVTSAHNSASGEVNLLADLLDDITTLTDNVPTTAAAAGGSKKPKFTLYYEETYIDILVALTEQILTLQPGSQSLTFTQNIWNFVALFVHSKSVHETPTQPVNAMKSVFDLSSSLLNMSFHDMPVAGGGQVAPGETHKAHAKQVLLKSLLEVVEITKTNFLTGAADAQIIANIRSAVLWLLAEHADAWVETDGIGASPLTTIINLLVDASSSSAGNSQRAAILGLIKVANALYLPPVLNGSYRSAITDSGLDGRVHSSLVYELTRVLLAQCGSALSVSAQIAVQKLLQSHEKNHSGTSCDLLKAFLSQLRVSPSNARDGTTIGDVWDADKDSLLAKVLAPTASVANTLYTSLVSSLLILYDYETHYGVGAASLPVHSVALIAPVAHRVMTVLIPVERVEEPEPEEAEERQTAASAEDTAVSVVGDPDDIFSFPAGSATSSVADTASVKSSSQHVSLPNKAKDKFGHTRGSFSAGSDGGSGFDWPTPSGGGVAGDVFPATPASGTSGWGMDDFSTHSGGDFGTSSMKSHDADVFGFAPTTGAVKPAASSGIADSWSSSDFASPGKTMGDSFGGGDSDLFAPTAADATERNPVAQSADDDFFASFSASSAAADADVVTSSDQTDLFAASSSPKAGSAKGKSAVTIKPPTAANAPKPMLTALAPPTKKAAVSRKGSTLTSYSVSAATAASPASASQGGDLFGFPGETLTPTSAAATTPVVASEWPATQSVGDAFSASTTDFGGDAFANSTVTAAPAADVGMTESGYATGYGSGYGAEEDLAQTVPFSAAAVTDAFPTQSEVVAGPTADDAFLFPSATPVVVAVAPTQPAKELISDLFGSDATIEDKPLPGLGGFGNDFGGSSGAFASAERSKPVVDTSSSDLFPSDDNQWATQSISSQPVSPKPPVVPLLAKPVTISNVAKSRLNMKRAGSVSTMSASSPAGSTSGSHHTGGNDADFDIFGPPVTSGGKSNNNRSQTFTQPTGSGAVETHVRSNSITSVASHESSHSQFSVKSQQSQISQLTANSQPPHKQRLSFGSTNADLDVFGGSTAGSSVANVSDSPFEDSTSGGWAATSATQKPKPVVPVLAKPVVPVLGKPSTGGVKVNPFAPSGGGAVTNSRAIPAFGVKAGGPASTAKVGPVTKPAPAIAPALGARRKSAIHSDLMDLDMPVLPADTSVTAPSGWPSAAAPATRSSFTSPPVDPFATSANFTAPAPAAADPFAPLSDFAPSVFASEPSTTTPAFGASTTSDGFAPSTAADASSAFPAPVAGQSVPLAGQPYAYPGSPPGGPADQPPANAAGYYGYPAPGAVAAQGAVAQPPYQDPAYAAYYAQQQQYYQQQQGYGQQQPSQQQAVYPPNAYGPPPQQQPAPGGYGYPYPPQYPPQQQGMPGQQQPPQGYPPAAGPYGAYPQYPPQQQR